MKIEIYNLIDSQHQLHYWYGGDCASIKHKGYEFILSANGDVNTTLLDKKNNEIAYVKDKNNAGSFYWEMREHIKNDKELIKYIRDGSLVLDNNNWWEVFVYDNSGNFHDIMCCLDSDYLLDAITEICDSVDEIIKYIETE